ncbi:hypothetical protein BKA56DRAFT_677717 [Ilyonectria sp. MPI-CAGE-AT-0026]|nr:hypothetical protein BKA56DRAFT_677717 [Ilyonectria sp. MPI-CAGE-AT-0026]
MATSRDLRDMVDRPSEFFMRVQHLRTKPPLLFPPSFVGTKTSGMDCLIQLIRHANSFCREHPRLPEEKRNPILPYSWQDFDLPDNDIELVKSMIADKKRLVNELRTLVPEGFSFASLAKSSLMNRTLWSSWDWALLRGFFDTDTHEGRSPGNLTEQGKVGLLQYHCHQESNVSIQTFINDFFMPKATQIPVSFRPRFVRVEYLSNPSQPWSFADLHTFEMPIGDLQEGDRGQRFVLPASWKDYYLIAAVRMRSDAQHHDSLQTYTRNGILVKMAQSAASFMTDDWSLGDAGGHCYMLLYMRTFYVPSLYRPEHFAMVADEREVSPDPVPNKGAMQADVGGDQSNDSQLEIEPEEHDLASLLAPIAAAMSKMPDATEISANDTPEAGPDGRRAMSRKFSELGEGSFPIPKRRR